MLVELLVRASGPDNTQRFMSQLDEYVQQLHGAFVRTDKGHQLQVLLHDDREVFLIRANPEWEAELRLLLDDHDVEVVERRKYFPPESY